MSTRTSQTRTRSTGGSALRRCLAALAAMAALLFGGLSTLPAETAAAAGVAKNSVVLTSAPSTGSSVAGDTSGGGRKR